MNAIQVLAAMAAFFTDHPDRWTFDAEARDDKNERVDAMAPNAYSFSATGFLNRICAENTVTDIERDKAFEMLHSVARRLYTKSLAQMNDAGRECVIQCAKTVVRDMADKVEQ